MIPITVASSNPIEFLNFILKMALAPILIIALLVDGYMAYWIVSKYIRFSNPPKYEGFIKVVVGMVLFFLFAFLTFLVVIDNARLVC